MLGLILLYFIGKAFYDLAKKNGQNGWGYAIGGIASYYGGIFLASTLFFTLYDLFIVGEIDRNNALAVSLLSVLFGVLICWLVYRQTKKHFEGKKAQSNADILDDEFIGDV